METNSVISENENTAHYAVALVESWLVESFRPLAELNEQELALLRACWHLLRDQSASVSMLRDQVDELQKTQASLLHELSLYKASTKDGIRR